MKKYIPGFKYLILLCIIAVNGGVAKLAYCFDDKNTHPMLTEQAVRRNVFINYLREQIGFSDGLDSKIKLNSLLGIFHNKSILKWLQTGSTEEDSPLCRASTHFHDPNKTWDLSYVTDSPRLIQQWCQNLIRVIGHGRKCAIIITTH